MENIDDYIEEEIIPNIILYGFTGSRYICDPPPQDTDLDIILYVDYVNIAHMKSLGWKVDGGYPAMRGYGFTSFKKDFNGTLVNYIMTESQEFYEKFIEATDIAKKLNLLDKRDRVGLFSDIMDRKNDNKQRSASELRPINQELLFEGPDDLLDLEGWNDGDKF